MSCTWCAPYNIHMMQNKKPAACRRYAASLTMTSVALNYWSDQWIRFEFALFFYPIVDIFSLFTFCTYACSVFVSLTETTIRVMYPMCSKVNKYDEIPAAVANRALEEIVSSDNASSPPPYSPVTYQWEKKWYKITAIILFRNSIYCNDNIFILGSNR